MDLIERALSLWTGAPYADLADWPAAVAEAERLREIRAEGEEDLLSARLECGEHRTVVPDAERLTGYKVGGIGPFGQKRQVPTAFDETLELYDRVYINAGQRGLLLSIAPADAVRVAQGKVADLCA